MQIIQVLGLAKNPAMSRQFRFDSSEGRPLPAVGDAVMFDTLAGEHVSGTVTTRHFSYSDKEPDRPDIPEAIIVSYLIDGDVF